VAEISISDVILILISAFGGAWANSWYRNRETKKARKQELEGLLILLSTEVRINNIALERFLKETSAQPDSDKRLYADHLHSAVWDESNARLAQLLPRTAEVATVALYYLALEQMRFASTAVSAKFSEDYTETVRSQREAGITVLKTAHRYISDPEIAAILSAYTKTPPS
jgi:hypothetical protein